MEKKYQIIYADPPWSYSNGTVPSGGVNKHYSTMHIDDICSIKVPSDKNAILFLWATTALLPEALRVIDSWGFTYKSSLVWDKIKRGVGYWFIGQHEFLLVGVKGKVSPPPQSKRILSVFKSKREGHSKKPDQIRKLIEDWYPDCTRLEMFARYDKQNNLYGENIFDKWDVWGNEVESDISLTPSVT